MFRAVGWVNQNSGLSTKTIVLQGRPPALAGFDAQLPAPSNRYVDAADTLVLKTVLETRTVACRRKLLFETILVNLGS